jgi:hypothetical protein
MEPANRIRAPVSGLPLAYFVANTTASTTSGTSRLGSIIFAVAHAEVKAVERCNRPFPEPVNDLKD